MSDFDACWVVDVGVTRRYNPLGPFLPMEQGRIGSLPTLTPTDNAKRGPILGKSAYLRAMDRTDLVCCIKTAGVEAKCPEPENISQIYAGSCNIGSRQQPKIIAQKSKR